MTSNERIVEAVFQDRTKEVAFRQALRNVPRAAIEAHEAAKGEGGGGAVDDALAFLDELNSDGRLEYSDYSTLHDLINAIDPTPSVGEATSSEREWSPEEVATFTIENEWALDSEGDPDVRAGWFETLNRVMDNRDEDTPDDIVSAIAAAVRLDRERRTPPAPKVETVEDGKLRLALSSVLCNAGNYPSGFGAHILGRDMGPLLDKAHDAVLKVLTSVTPTSPPASSEGVTVSKRDFNAMAESVHYEVCDHEEGEPCYSIALVADALKAASIPLAVPSEEGEKPTPRHLFSYVESDPDDDECAGCGKARTDTDAHYLTDGASS